MQCCLPWNGAPWRRTGWTGVELGSGVIIGNRCETDFLWATSFNRSCWPTAKLHLLVIRRCAQLRILHRHDGGMRELQGMPSVDALYEEIQDERLS